MGLSVGRRRRTKKKKEKKKRKKKRERERGGGGGEARGRDGWKETETPRAGLQHLSATVIIDYAMGPSIYLSLYPSLSLYLENV